MKHAVKGIAIIAAAMLLGAGCSPTASQPTPNPGPQPVPPAATGTNGSGTDPVAHEEPILSNPDQNY